MKIEIEHSKSLRWLLGFALGIIAVVWVSYLAVGRSIIERLHGGEVIGGVVLEGRLLHPVEFYFHKADALLFAISVLVLIVAVYGFLLVRQRHAVADYLRKDLFWRRPRASALQSSFRERPLRQEHRAAIFCLFVVFLALYVFAGARWLDSPAISEDSLLFEADPLLTATDMTDAETGIRSTPARHPLLVLFVNPLGSVLGFVMPGLTAALLINGLFGALGVVLAFLVLDRWGLRLAHAMLLAALFGMTMSQLFFGTLPETYALAACTLLIIFLLTVVALRNQQIDVWHWVAAGVLAAGVTYTNIAQAWICFAMVAVVLARQREPYESPLPAILVYPLAVKITVAVLAVVQTLLYPSTQLFFLPGAQVTSFGYLSLQLLTHLWQLVSRELPHFLLTNVTGAVPALMAWPGTSLPAVTYDAPLQFTPLGFAAAWLWLALFVGGTLMLFRAEREDRTLCGILAACAAYNFILHSFFGIGETGRVEFFLYSPHFTFAVIAMVMIPLIRRVKTAAVPITALLVLLVLNNLDVLSRILAIYE